MNTLFSDLKNRGYIFQTSSDAIETYLEGAPRTIYLGIDPTADSLHVGTLSMLMLVKAMRDRGHRLILVVGGATGMIGDPSGKSEERNLLSEETIEHNVRSLKKQLEKVLGGDFMIVNNNDWMSGIKFVDFLRDTGKLFSVNTMLTRDAVKSRLGSEQFFSYTEFSYSLLQAYDFWHLFKTEGATIQIGGSDQWGNMVSGIELIRKREEAEAFVITSPLILNRKTGKKFGKTEGGTVWLDAEKTSPYEMYQFWLGTDDEDLPQFLNLFTTLPEETLTELLEAHDENPGVRLAQKRLALEVVTFIHGEDHATNAQAVSEVLFGDASVESLDEATRALITEVVPTHRAEVGTAFSDLLVDTGIASSKREARELLSSGAVVVNKSEIIREDGILLDEYFIEDMFLLKKGKREYCVFTR